MDSDIPRWKVRTAQAMMIIPVVLITPVVFVLGSFVWACEILKNGGKTLGFWEPLSVLWSPYGTR